MKSIGQKNCTWHTCSHLFCPHSFLWQFLLLCRTIFSQRFFLTTSTDINVPSRAMIQTDHLPWVKLSHEIFMRGDHACWTYSKWVSSVASLQTGHLIGLFLNEWMLAGWGQQTRCWQKQFCRLPPFLHNCTVALGCGISRRGSDSWIWHQSHAAVCFTNIIWEIKQSNEEFTQPISKIH